MQTLFARNRDLLAHHGVIFPRIGPEGGQHALVGVWNTLMLPSPRFDARAAWRDLAARHARGSQTVFVSSEEFSRMNARRINMAELATLTAPFDEVRVICTLRNQASFLQSIYLQISAKRPPADWDSFFARAVQTHMADGLTLNYDRFYGHLLRGFARRQIRLVSYDHAIAQPGGIIGAYLRALDLPFGPEALAPVPEAEANVSPQPLATFAACHLMRPAPPSASLVALMQDGLDHSFGKHLRQTLFTRPEVAQIAAVFGPLNAALSRRIAPYQPGFTLGPMLGSILGPPPDLYRCDLTEAFWSAASRHAPPLGTALPKRVWRRILDICLD